MEDESARQSEPTAGKDDHRGLQLTFRTPSAQSALTQSDLIFLHLLQNSQGPLRILALLEPSPPRFGPRRAISLGEEELLSPVRSRKELDKSESSSFVRETKRERDALEVEVKLLPGEANAAPVALSVAELHDCGGMKASVCVILN